MYMHVYIHMYIYTCINTYENVKLYNIAVLYKSIAKVDQNHYKTLNKHSINVFKPAFKPFIHILKRILTIFEDFQKLLFSYYFENH